MLIREQRLGSDIYWDVPEKVLQAWYQIKATI